MIHLNYFGGEDRGFELNFTRTLQKLPVGNSE